MQKNKNLSYEEIQELTDEELSRKNNLIIFRARIIANKIHESVLHGKFKILEDSNLSVNLIFVKHENVENIDVAAELLRLNIQLISWDRGILISNFRVKTLLASSDKSAVVKELNLRFFNTYTRRVIGYEDNHFFTYVKKLYEPKITKNEFSSYNMILDPNELKED